MDTAYHLQDPSCPDHLYQQEGYNYHTNPPVYSDEGHNDSRPPPYAPSYVPPAPPYVPLYLPRAPEINYDVAQTPNPRFKTKWKCPRWRCPIRPQCWNFWTSTNLICLGFGLVSFIIAITLYYTIVLPDQTYKTPYVATHCIYMENQEQTNPCCDVINCQCSPCGNNLPSCASLTMPKGHLLSYTNLTVNTPCCNGYNCCNSQRDICYKDIYTECNCYYYDNIRYCAWCHDQTQYPCGDYKCTHSVTNDLCTQACGYCTQVITPYQYNITHGAPSLIQTGQLEISCSRDNWSCYQTWINNHPPGRPVLCWYDSRNPTSGVQFNEPKHHSNVEAIVFSIIFAVVFVICAIFLLTNSRCRWQSCF